MGVAWPGPQVRGALLVPIQQMTSGLTAGLVGQLASTLSPLDTQVGCRASHVGARALLQGF